MKPEPVTQEVAAAPDKPASAKSRNNIKGNSSADVSVSGNSIGNSAGSTGNDKDFGVSADPPAAHSAMPAGQNDPVSLATGAVNAVPAPAGTLDKDSTSVSPVKAGGASITGAAAMPDADDAVPPLNESRVVNVAQMGGDQGHSQVRIAMQSDQLGQVELHATVRGQQVGAAITVEKKEAHAAMAAEMPSLQQALEDRQLRVGEVVLMQGAMHSTTGDAGNAAAEQQRRGQAGTTYQQLENETMYEAGGGTSFESSGIFDDSGRLSVRA
jgi:flagellar hook-length control protein FliK